MGTSAYDDLWQTVRNDNDAEPRTAPATTDMSSQEFWGPFRDNELKAIGKAIRKELKARKLDDEPEAEPEQEPAPEPEAETPAPVEPPEL